LKADYEVFIAYHRDFASDYAKHLKQSLEKIRKHAFLDVCDIPKGIEKEEFQWRIYRDEAINSSKTFILLLTRGFENSKEIKYELKYALEKDIPKFFLKHEYVPWDVSIELNETEFNFGNYNLVEFKNEYDLARKVLNILDKEQIRKPKIETFSFHDDFEDETIGNVPSKWSILRQRGELFIQNGIGMDGISNYLVISSPDGSNDYASLITPRLKTLSLTYEFKQDYFRGSRVGSGVNLFSDSTQAVWLGIRLGGLYYFNEIERYKPIMQVEVGRWYKVSIDLDCNSKLYDVSVNNEKMASNIQFRNEVDFINRISTLNWIKQENWQTCIDNIKLDGIRY